MYNKYRREASGVNGVVSTTIGSVNEDDFAASFVSWNSVLFVRQVPPVSELNTRCCDRWTSGGAT